MKTFKEVISEEKKLKTQKGSPIKRSKYGVGKLIGGVLYFHRQYMSILPEDVYDKNINILYDSKYEDFKYNIIKWDIKKDLLTFVNSPDFDTADEPVAGDYVAIKSDGTVRKGSTKSIWHHKWLWVKDDYKGFNVEESYRRSEAWLTIPMIEFSKIGNKAFWEKNYVPEIDKMDY